MTLRHPLGVCSVEPQDSPGMAKTLLGDVPALPAALGELPQVKLFTANEPEQQNHLCKEESSNSSSRKEHPCATGCARFPLRSLKLRGGEDLSSPATFNTIVLASVNV